MNVKNRKCIRKLSLKSLYANRRRNLIAIFAIALTTLLFTSMFTIVLSLNASYETYQFRQVGGYAHGTFKDVSPEQAERIAAHPKVKAVGARKAIGITADGVFSKTPAEISYMDANCTRWSYATPTTGRMPESGKEVAMDTTALQLLGVTPELGAEVTVSYSITDKDQTAFTVTDTFTLVGYWDYAMCVSALALTSLDAVARIGRMSFQELFSVDDMEHAEGWRKLFCNVYFSTILTLAFGYVLTKVGYANIWPLFGSANQLLSALVLITLCVFLRVTGRSNKMIFPPLIIMLCVTFTALVQRLLAMVKAISAAASTTIPAGETTWGAVFIANGLQLILAVLLIVLGLTIVIHSFKAYAKSEKNSESAKA